MTKQQVKVNRNPKLWEAFQEFQRRTGIKQKEFAERWGVHTVSNLSQYLHGWRPLNIETAVKLSEGMGVKLNDFIDEEMRNLIIKAYEQLDKDPLTFAKEGNQVGVYDLTQSLLVATGSRATDSGTTQTDYSKNRELFAIRVDFDDMAPRYRRGDVLIVDMKTPPKPTDVVVAQAGCLQEAVVREYSVLGVDKTGKAQYELTPLDKRYPVFNSENDDVRILGVVIEHRHFRGKC